jgi:hypothetical protein
MLEDKRRHEGERHVVTTTKQSSTTIFVFFQVHIGPASLSVLCPHMSLSIHRDLDCSTLPGPLSPLTLIIEALLRSCSTPLSIIFFFLLLPATRMPIISLSRPQLATSTKDQDRQDHFSTLNVDQHRHCQCSEQGHQYALASAILLPGRRDLGGREGGREDENG